VKANYQRLLMVYACLLALVCSTACGSTTSVVETTVTPTPAPIVEYSTETVSFTAEDDIELVGTLFLSEGDTAVVLTHMAGENDQQNWIPFANEIASRGFTALTFDFRCYGQSDCGGRESGAILLSWDVGAAIGFLREQGFQRIVCIGASMGGRGCITVAFDEELAGLVIVSGTGSSDPNRQNLENFVNRDMPKLFIVSENDRTAGRTLEMTRLYESAPEPKIFKTFPGSAHGTELFSTEHGKEFRETILSFLEGIRSSR
jgi:pimeloyl-ACP methyl ester carboxylesterase